MDNAMVDLETTGKAPGCGILSIGVTLFGALGGETLGSHFYVTITRESCIRAGLHEDPETLQWWSEQSEEARKVFTDHNAVDLRDAFDMLGAWLAHVTDVSKLKMWGNGADFDNAILAAAYNALGMKTPWRFYNNRCYRTLKNLFPQVRLPQRQGTHHNALDDARTQAAHASKLLAYQASLVVVPKLPLWRRALNGLHDMWLRAFHGPQ